VVPPGFSNQWAWPEEQETAHRFNAGSAGGPTLHGCASDGETGDNKLPKPG